MIRVTDLTPVKGGYVLNREGKPVVRLVQHPVTDKYMVLVGGKFLTAGTLDYVLREIEEKT